MEHSFFSTSDRIRHSHHPSALVEFSKFAFEPRNLIAGGRCLKKQMDRSHGLVRDEDAEAEDFNLSLPYLSGYKWEETIKTFMQPLGMGLSENLGKEEFKASEQIVEMLGTWNTGTVGQISENRPKPAADMLLCFRRHNTPCFVLLRIILTGMFPVCKPPPKPRKLKHLTRRKFGQSTPMSTPRPSNCGGGA